MAGQIFSKIQKNIHKLKGASIPFLIGVVALNLGGFIPNAVATTNTSNGLKVEKLVSNTKAPAWKEEVDADPGDIVEFKITFWNLTGGAMTNVIVRDVLPEGLTYFPGHFHIIANAGQVDNPANLNDFFGTGINISQYSTLGLPGGLPPYDAAHNWEYVELLFKATVACSPTVAGTTLTNRGYVRTDQAGEVSATAVVKTDLCAMGLDLEKLVSNTNAPGWKKSVGAKRDDLVEFKLTFKNTGEVILNDVTVRDVLPDKLAYHSDGKIKIVRNSGTAISTDAAAFLGSGLNIGDLPPYNAAHNFEYIEVTFMASPTTCSSTSITTTNEGYVRASGVSEISDTAGVTIAPCGSVLGEKEIPKVLAATGPENVIATALYLGYLGFLLRRLKLTKYF